MFEVRNVQTGVIVGQPVATYREALALATSLTNTTKIMHFVPMRVTKPLNFAV